MKMQGDFKIWISVPLNLVKGKSFSEYTLKSSSETFINSTNGAMKFNESSLFFSAIASDTNKNCERQV